MAGGSDSQAATVTTTTTAAAATAAGALSSSSAIALSFLSQIQGTPSVTSSTAASPTGATSSQVDRRSVSQKNHFFLVFFVSFVVYKVENIQFRAHFVLAGSFRVKLVIESGGIRDLG